METEWPIGKFLALLPSAKKRGDGWDAKCPAHDDQHASLSVAEGRDHKVILRCHAGCTVAEVVSALGLSLGDLFPPRVPAKRIAAVYDYRDRDGTLLYQAVRYEPKGFNQRQPDPARPGEFIWNLHGIRGVPFRLPEITAAVEKGVPVYVVEGEKDVLALVKRGLEGTCNAGGAGKWREEFRWHLRAASVVVLPDNDTAGKKHAEDVLYSLNGTAASLKLLQLPDLPDKGDVSDWFDAGGTPETLAGLAAKEPEWKPASRYVQSEAAPSGTTYQKNFEIEKIEKVDTDPPIYYVHLLGGRVKMTGIELGQWGRFKLCVMQVLNRVPDIRNPNLNWSTYLDDCMLTKLEVLQAPEEASKAGSIWHHIRQYIQMRSVEDEAVIAEYRGVFSNERYFYLHGPTLHKYLSHRGIRIEEADMWDLLRERGAQNKDKRFRDSAGAVRMVSVWFMDKQTVNGAEDPEM